MKRDVRHSHTIDLEANHLTVEHIKELLETYLQEDESHKILHKFIHTNKRFMPWKETVGLNK